MGSCAMLASGVSGLDHDKFDACLATRMSISRECSECFAVLLDTDMVGEDAWVSTWDVRETFYYCTNVLPPPPREPDSDAPVCSDDEYTKLTDFVKFEATKQSCEIAALGLNRTMLPSKFTTCLSSQMEISLRC